MWNEAICFFVILAVTAVLAGVIVWLLMRRKLRDIQDDFDQFRTRHGSCAADLSAANKARDELQAELERAQGECAECEQERERLRNELNAAKSAEPAGLQTAMPLVDADDDPDEAEALARVRARAEKIDFGRIGTASAETKDDLKIVKGIGPFIERKLNALGIYKFEQIANFTPDDEEMVNEAIEFFPGRIRRDEWARQARELAAQS